MLPSGMPHGRRRSSIAVICKRRRPRMQDMLHCAPRLAICHVGALDTPLAQRKCQYALWVGRDSAHISFRVFSGACHTRHHVRAVDAGMPPWRHKGKIVFAGPAPGGSSPIAGRGI